MEKLQGSINPCLLQEELGMGCCLEDENGALYISQFSSNNEDFEQGNEPYDSLLPSLEDNVPFLQMLQGVESPSYHHHHHLQQQQIQNPFYPLMQEPNFQLLLKLQHQKSMLMKPFNESYNNISCLASGELESCVTNNNDIVMDLKPSPIATPQISSMDHSNVEKSIPKGTTSFKGKKSQMVGPTKEKKKRKRTITKPSKNKEEVETQRMTHIAVERNRRRLMNEHLNALRSLMPPSYVQRGDQASIIGGAIDFVKELEHLLQTLEAQKRMRQYEEQNGDVSRSSTSSSPSNMFKNMLTVPSTSSCTSPLSYQHSHSHDDGNVNESIEEGKLNEELSAENRSKLGDIQVMVIQNHVNLKIRCQRRAGQLINAIVALEQLSLTVLHLNVTSMHSFVYYSFNLKIEEECKLGSADEVATAVHQIFRFINS